MDAEQTLRAIPGFADAQVIKQLAESSTGRTFLVSHATQDYVLRVRSERAVLFVPDGFAEHHFSRLAYTAGLAPEPAFCSADGRVLLRRFAPGQAWSESKLTVSGLERLGMVLARLHQIPVVAESNAWAEQALLRYSVSALDAGGAALDAGMRVLAEIGAYPPISALCHGDLVCGNIVEHDAALQLIDWEYSRVADPYFDLAVFLAHHQLPPDEAKILLNAYAGPMDGHMEARLELWVNYYLALQTLWLLALQQQSLISPAQQSRLEELLLV